MDATEPTDPLAAFHPFSPFHRPWWRWGLADYLLENKLPVRREYRDKWFIRTLRYRRGARRAEGPGDARLTRLDPEIHAAYQLACGDPRTIFELELRVLSKQPYQRIAECCCVSPAVIVAYEQLFYDMRRVLGASDYVLAQIQRLHWPGVRPDPVLDLQALIREVAYANGPYMMEPALRVYDERYCRLRIEGKADPNPRFTRSIGVMLDFMLWSDADRNDMAMVDLYILAMRGKQSLKRHDCSALFRPLRSTMAPSIQSDAASAPPRDGASSSSDQDAREPSEAVPDEPEGRLPASVLARAG